MEKENLKVPIWGIKYRFAVIGIWAFLCLTMQVESLFGLSFSKSELSDFLNNSDTLDLETVEVFIPKLERYRSGQNVISISKEDVSGFQGLPFADYLQQRTGLFLRQYGPGMLASLTMRGTSAGHNAVFWNGLPINSPSLGQSDFSILPIGGFDQAEIHFGSGGALYGTDAIGGSVHLQSSPQFRKGHQMGYTGLMGSFGKQNHLLSYGYSDDNISVRTRVYRNYSRNDFPFQNLAKPGTPIERQRNAQILQWGINQDLAWNIKPNRQLQTSIWYNDTDRQIMPLMGSNTNDFQLDQNLRWSLDYYSFGQNMVWNVKAGLVRDRLNFNIQSQNLALQYLLATDLDWQLGEKWHSRTGIRYTHVIGLLDTYEAKEDRIELYQSFGFQPISSLAFSFNLRQMVFDGNWVPFTPSIGGEWDFWQKGFHQLKLKSVLARSFKIPTLNDRFWVPGGNPDLESEKSWSGELGLHYLFSKNNFRFEQQITHFRMSVDNWIIWLPQGNIWRPQNIRKVHNSGLEYFMEISQVLGPWKIGLDVNYNWNRAINQTDISENDRSKGKQLPYTPVHKIQNLLYMERDSWRVFVNHNWVAERFTGTDNSEALLAYRLFDAGLSYDYSLTQKIKGNLGIQVLNLFDQDYQIMRLRPMPGRNYQINLNIQI